MFAVVSSIVRGLFRPQGRLNCAHQLLMVMCRVGRLIGHMPAWAQLVSPLSMFVPSAPTCAAGTWLAQHVLAQSVFSYGFSSAQQAAGRRSAPAVQ